MKKLIMMAVMAVVALTASAQKGEFHVTPHITAGYAHMSDAKVNPDVGDFDMSNHVLAGAGVDLEYMLSNTFGLSVGADYNFIRSTTEKEGSHELYLNYSYLNVPVLAQLHVGEGLAFKAGFQPMFVLDAKVHAKGNSGSDSDSFKDELKSVAYAIPVGISYTFATPITMDLRCNIPVTKVNKTDELDMKMLSVTLSLGYRF